MKNKKIDDLKTMWLDYTPETIDAELALKVLRNADYYVNPSDDTDIHIQYPTDGVDTMSSTIKKDAEFFNYIQKAFSRRVFSDDCDPQFVLAVVQRAINEVEYELEIYEGLKKVLLAKGAKEFYED